MPEIASASRIVFISHYFPPINGVGAKRVEAMAKYMARAGRSVTVVTTRKTAADGDFTEGFPDGIIVHQINWLGRVCDSFRLLDKRGYGTTVRARAMRGVKKLVMRMFGQLPDPRLPFALGFLSPFLSRDVRRTFESADIVVGSCPPWPALLAAVFVRWRFGKRVVLDYRDHFSECHEMPGTPLAKAIERWVDRALAGSVDGLITVSEPMALYYGKFNPRVAVVLNGYDPEVVDNVRKDVRWQPRGVGSPLTIRYLGLITPGRIPRNLLAALLRIQGRKHVSESSVRLEFYGDCAILEDTLRKEYPSLLGMFTFHPAVPYREALGLMVTSDYLLFSETSFRGSLSAQGILTTKLFEYLACGRPLIADIDPETLAGRLIRKAGQQHVSTRVESFEEHLLHPDFWNPIDTVDHPFVKTLSRPLQAEQYLRELDGVCREQRLDDGRAS